MVLRVDPHLINGPYRGPHPRLHPRALESRSRRAGAGDQPVEVAQHDLAVGANINKQGELLRLVHQGAEHARGDVGADIAAHSGQAIHCGLGIDVQAQFARPDRQRMVHRGNVGLQTNGFRPHPQEQVNHGGIAGHGGLVNLRRRDALALGQILYQTVQGLNHQPLEVFQTTGALGVHDARDDVLATGDLLVILGSRVHHLAAE